MLNYLQDAWVVGIDLTRASRCTPWACRPHLSGFAVELSAVCLAHGNFGLEPERLVKQDDVAHRLLSTDRVGVQKDTAVGKGWG
jgi:hypothetical protein